MTRGTYTILVPCGFHWVKMSFGLVKGDKGVPILCKYPRGFVGQNGTQPSQKR